jgi:hypothetical protein
VELIDNAIFELEEIRMAAEYDEGSRLMRIDPDQSHTDGPAA